MLRPSTSQHGFTLTPISNNSFRVAKDGDDLIMTRSQRKSSGRIAVSSQSERGFTLIELMVSIGVIGLITAIVVFNQSDLSDRISLANAASEIDLQIREVQTYGISVREFRPGSNSFSDAYGVDFNINSGGSGTAGNPTTFYVFADLNESGALSGTWGTCAPGPSAECISPVILSRGNSITKLCVITSTGSETCTDGSSGTFRRLAITFLRPNPAAIINFLSATGSVVNFANHRGAKIEVSSPKGETKTISVYTTGQVSVQ